MKKIAINLLLTSLIASSVYAENQDHNRVEFYNNTKFTMHVNQDIYIGKDMSSCKSPAWCIKPSSEVIIQPYSVGSLSLETNVTDNKIHQGSVGFSIRTDDYAESTVTIPVTATPKDVYIETVSFNNPYSTAISKANGSLPEYVVSLAQNEADHDIDANQTVIVMSPLK